MKLNSVHQLKPSYRLTLGLLFLSLFANAVTRAEVTPQVLEAEVAARIERVAEFKTIRNAAQELGIHAWIFGGTASAFGHYVRWDLERQAGDLRYNAARFDYHYSNIFRSSQDLDVVIDATEEQRKKFEAFLQERFPYVQGSKTKWEVRLLKQSSGDKDSLLGNRDYLDQHTDSNSTGMIEISTPSKDESVVRDLRNWDSRSSDFLEDLSTGTIHYYYSPTHGTTARAKAGKNPEILSAIRYLTKVVQYDLKTSTNDLERIREIVSRYNPSANHDSYVSHWIPKNAPKLFQNAIDLEHAWTLVDEVGLRAKFLKDSASNLSRWFAKEPLRSYPIGQGPGPTGSYKDRPSGKTAQELNLRILSHGTSDFNAFESITMSRMGLPNFFISRNNAEGEAAIYGNGVYFMPGRKGFGHSNFTIRVLIDPRAIEGKDFVVVNDGHYVIALNRTAFTVMPESLSVDIVEWFRMLSRGNQFSDSDQGIIQGIRSRVEKDATRITDAQDLEISKILSESTENPEHSLTVLREWSRMKLPLKHFRPSPLTEFMLSLGIIGASKETLQMGPAMKSLEKKITGQNHWNSFSEAVKEMPNPEIRMRAYQAWLASINLSNENTLEELFEMLLDVADVMHYEERGFKALWAKAVDERLVKPLSAEAIGRLRNLLKTKFPRAKSYDVFFSCIAQSDLPEKVFLLDDWIELAAQGHVKSKDYRSGIETILARSDLVASPATRKRAQEIAIELAVKNNGQLPSDFFKLWVYLPISAQESNLVTKTLARSLTDEEINKLLESHPGKKILTGIIEHAEKETLEKIFKNWVARIQYDNEHFFAEALAEYSDLIIRKVVEQNITTFRIESVIHDMRRKEHHATLIPFFRRWVDVAISQKNISMLTPIAKAYFFQEIQPLAGEFKKIVDLILSDPKQYESILAILCDRVGGTQNIDIASQLTRLMRYAMESKQPKLLAVMADKWAPSPELVRADPELLTDLVHIYQETRDWKSFDSFIYKRRGLISPSEFDLYLSTTVQNRLKTIFDRLSRSFPQDPVRNLGTVETRRRLTLMIDVAERYKWLEQLHHVANSTFSAYQAKDAMPVESFMRFLDAGYRNADFKLISEMVTRNLMERPEAVHTHFKLAHREFIRRLLAIKSSSSKSEIAFKAEMLAKIDKIDDYERAWFPKDLREDYEDLHGGKEARFNARYPDLEKTVTEMVARERDFTDPCKSLLKRARAPKK